MPGKKIGTRVVSHHIIAKVKYVLIKILVTVRSSQASFVGHCLL